MHGPEVADARRLMPARKSILPQRKAIMPPIRHYSNIASEQPYTGPPVHKSMAEREAHGSTFFTPHQAALAGQMAQRNDPLDALSRRVNGFLQLRQLVKQTVGAFNPTTKGGAVQDAAMFYGGPGEDTTSLMNREMPGQFERYSLGKASADGHLTGGGSSGWIHTENGSHPISEVLRVARDHPDPAVRANAMRLIHDHFFGGEVHAAGDIPPQP